MESISDAFLPMCYINTFSSVKSINFFFLILSSCIKIGFVPLPFSDVHALHLQMSISNEWEVC